MSIIKPLLCLLLFYACKTKQEIFKPTGVIQIYTTSGDKSVLLQEQTLSFSLKDTVFYPSIHIDTSIHFQSVDGFGFTLTGSSALLLHQMDGAKRKVLLNELFSAEAGLNISCLRISIGASDLDPRVFSYDDHIDGGEGPALKGFTLADDTIHLIPILREILAIHPDIKIFASPWSPPVWMKSNRSSKGGYLLKKFYPVYARYIIKYIQAMQAYGINIDAITVQNEPQNDQNNPSLLMSSQEQADFIKNDLGPAFRSSLIFCKILIWDHNCDRPDYPLAILSDSVCYSFVSGSAFHLYAGNVNVLSCVHDSFPNKAIYLTEQWTGANGDFAGDLCWHMKNVIIGCMRNWSRTALEWNLANDPFYGPHTEGGCTECLGALTIEGSKVTRNVAYYIIAQASKFVPPGSIRVGSDLLEDLPNVTFRSPEGKIILIVLNEGPTDKNFGIVLGERQAVSMIKSRSVSTYIF